MSTAMKIKNVERKIKDFNESLTLFEQQFILIPYVPSGYTAYSNFGEVTENYAINEFETYKRYYTGNESFIINWKDSCVFDYSQQNNNENTVESIKIKYQCGDYLMGWLEAADITNSIDTDTSYSEYKSQKNINSIVMRINASKFTLTEEYAFYFYKIPEISNQVLYKVDSIDREFLGNDLMCYVIRLSSLQDALANTGKAKAQNVVPNAPGQGYINPKIISKEELENGLIEYQDYKQTLDPNRIIVNDYKKQANNPVKYVVLKMFGLSWLMNVSFVGRRVTLGRDFRDYGVPRLVFPMNFSVPTTYTLYRTQSTETNYYWINEGYPEISFTKEAFDALKDFLSFTSFWTSQGNFFWKNTETLTSNPKDEKGNFVFQLYGNLSNSGEYVPWTFYFPQKEVDTSLTYGTAKKYTIGGNKIVHNHMFDCYWVQKYIKSLPLNKTSTLNFGWTVGSAYAASTAKNIYSSIALIVIGISAALIQKAITPRLQGLYGLFPAELLEFIAAESRDTLINTTATGSNTEYGRLNYLMNNETQDEIKGFFNTNTINTSFEAELTDTITKNGKDYTTDMIGQTVDANGNEILNGSQLLMDGSYILKSIGPKSDTGFIIDSFNIQAVFKGDFSIEFLDINKEVIWSGVYQSEAKWTNSIREINTWKDTSIFGRENMYMGKPLKWPKALADLNPDIEQEELLLPSEVDYLVTTPGDNLTTFNTTSLAVGSAGNTEIGETCLLSRLYSNSALGSPKQVQTDFIDLEFEDKDFIFQNEVLVMNGVNNVYTFLNSFFQKLSLTISSVFGYTYDLAGSVDEKYYTNKTYEFTLTAKNELESNFTEFISFSNGGVQNWKKLTDFETINKVITIDGYSGTYTKDFKIVPPTPKGFKQPSHPRNIVFNEEQQYTQASFSIDWKAKLVAKDNNIYLQLFRNKYLYLKNNSSTVENVLCGSWNLYGEGTGGGSSPAKPPFGPGYTTKLFINSKIKNIKFNRI